MSFEILIYPFILYSNHIHLILKDGNKKLKITYLIIIINFINFFNLFYFLR